MHMRQSIMAPLLGEIKMQFKYFHKQRFLREAVEFSEPQHILFVNREWQIVNEELELVCVEPSGVYFMCFRNYYTKQVSCYVLKKKQVQRHEDAANECISNTENTAW